ncbi:AbrB/MazE/SpoVT family DNA-binding domain-containing protein [Priestia aryabhattai]|uniref:AbrB/MazE/SpoVT family DNA-binding domain-containing protein n=1 Tax=Priestia aryabhattai TaxID=412384 RepID=UPI003982E33F
MVMAHRELERRIPMSNPKKVKRVAVSSKRQISIPKEFHDLLNIGEEVVLELHGNHIVLKPAHENFDDFSENILQDLIKEGYNGDELLTEFRSRKGQLSNAVKSLVEETKALGKRTTIDDLFGEEEEDEL